ncbi:hypothetical protein [Nocardioides pacificus]
MSVAGKDLTCVVCGVGQEFVRREVKMNTEGLSLLNLDFLNKSADGAICTTCGYVHLFMGGTQTWAPPA